MARRTRSKLDAQLPHWADAAARAFPAGASWRFRDGRLIARFQRQCLSLRPLESEELALRAAVPGAFPELAGVTANASAFLIWERPPRGVRLDRRGSDSRYRQLAMLVWQLHAAGYTLGDIELQRIMSGDVLKLLTLPGRGTEARAATALAMARAFVTGSRATAGLRADRIGPLVLRIMGGEAAAVPMLRATLGQLPDAASWLDFARAQVSAARGADLPVIVPVIDADQGHGLRALLLQAATEAGIAAGDGVVFDGLRVMGPLAISDCSRRLARLSTMPTVALVVGTPVDVTRELEHAGMIAPPVRLTPGGLFEWLKPLRIEASLVVEQLVPPLLADAANARRLVSALIEGAGAVADETPRLADEWPDHWSGARTRRGTFSVLQPDAARVALLLALSPGGLRAEALADARELSRGAALLEQIGLARREGPALLAAEGGGYAGANRAARASALLWLSEREYLAPDQEPARRAAWRIGLRLRAGDLSSWDAEAESTLKTLVERRDYEQALLLLEAHAAGAARAAAGPPSVDALFLAFDLGRAAWPLRRLRRVLRLWLRGYQGDWRALGLALRGRVERSLGGAELYAPRIDEALRLAMHLPRFAREQALIEAATCLCQDDPQRALALLAEVSRQPARAAKYLSVARVLLVRAECEFVAIRPQESIRLLQDARDAMPPAAHWTRRARVEAELESRYVAAHGMLSVYRSDTGPQMQALVELQQQTGLAEDVLRATIVNDRLMRMRMSEVGSMTPGQVDNVLADAPPENLRGYLIVLYQLEENAVYRGDVAAARQLNARLLALNADGERNRFVLASTWRHAALLHALEGRAADAIKAWRKCGDWMVSEPWRSRMRMLRDGEHGFLLLLCGRFGRARRLLQRGYEGMASMGAGTRGAHFLMHGVLADALAGRQPTEQDLENFRTLVKRGQRFAMALLPVIECARGVLAWGDLPGRIDATDAPDFWKALAAAMGAVLALGARDAAAPALARAARERLAGRWPVLEQWLAREFPKAPDLGQQLPAAALRALLEMRLPDSNTETLATAAMKALTAAGVDAAVQIGLGDAGRAGSRADGLSDALERAMLGERVLEHDLAAVGMAAPFGALAARGRDVEAVLAAVSARLAELTELAETRRSGAAQRRAGRDAVRAAWALASSEPTLGSQLEALCGLVRVEIGAAAASISLRRGRHELIAAGDSTGGRLSASADVDQTLRLVISASGGDTAALDEAARRAAQALAAFLRRAPETLRRQLVRPDDGEALLVDGELIGHSRASLNLVSDLRRFADLELPVEIIGEAGSGKDLMARGLHAMSQRAGLPLVVVDCATLRRETAASELFGHMRGAFTGATHDHVGLLERAAEGTLQMDGIAELEPSIQAMLLRAFQARTFLPVGGLRDREFKARLVVTSDRALRELAADGRLRDDLAQRLQGLTLRIPPLRERGDDALHIARAFLEVQCRQLNRRFRLARSAEKFILDHDWPGNVRELRATIVRASVMADGDEIGVQHLHAPDVGGAGKSLLLPPDAVDMSTSARLVLGALRGVGEAAPGLLVRRLGLSRTTVSTSLSEIARRGLCERIGRGRATRYRAI